MNDDEREDNQIIDVRFDGSAWCIEDAALDKPLQFSRLADAEARASELSKETGRGVCVHSWDGGLIDTFGEPPAEEPTGFFEDAATRFALLELY